MAQLVKGFIVKMRDNGLNCDGEATYDNYSEKMICFTEEDAQEQVTDMVLKTVFEADPFEYSKQPCGDGVIFKSNKRTKEGRFCKIWYDEREIVII